MTTQMTAQDIINALNRRIFTGALLWAGEIELLITPMKDVANGYAITSKTGKKIGVTNAQLVPVAPNAESWCASLLPLDDGFEWGKSIPAWTLFQALPKCGQRRAWNWATDVFPDRYPTAQEFIDYALTGVFNED